MNENKARSRLDQRRAPIYEALERFRQMRVVPFDVPGHKRGRGNPELTAFLGQQCVGVDVNSMKPLDNLCHPVSVIREAEELAADAFGAAHVLFNGRWHHQQRAEHMLPPAKRGDEIILAPQCAPQRAERAGALRRGAGVCRTGGGVSVVGTLAWAVEGGSEVDKGHRRTTTHRPSVVVVVGTVRT